MDQNTKNKYESVRLSLENAVKTSDNIVLDGDEENAELTFVRQTLNDLNEGFKSEIEKLENSSEWDKFCMAFFGETNAGKSTIIEALRIVYYEESRHEEIEKQNIEYKQNLDDEKASYAELADSLKKLNESLDKTKKPLIVRILTVIGLILVGMIIGFALGYLMTV